MVDGSQLRARILAMDPGDQIKILIERHGVTQYGLAPTTARVLTAAGEQWVEPYELETLRLIVSAGEPWTLPAWEWLHRHVGRGWVPIINWSGGTEVGGCIVSGLPNAPTKAGRFSGPMIGMAADVVDHEGRALVGEEGEVPEGEEAPAEEGEAPEGEPAESDDEE